MTERLAELLVERDLEGTCDMQQQSYDPRHLCGLGGYCTNPHRADGSINRHFIRVSINIEEE